MLKIIKANLTNRYFNNILAVSLELKKLVDWSKILLAIIVILNYCNKLLELISKDYNICIASKIIKYKPYVYLQLLSILNYY